MGSFFSATIILSSICMIENQAFINNNVDCYNDYAYEGSFEFLDDKGEAFWHIESDNVYFEYYFPASCWTGIAASNQYSNNKYNYCVDCYKQNQDVSHCLAQCVGDSMFVVTSKSDNDPELPWKILEFKTKNNGQNNFNQYQIPSKLHSVWGIKGRENASFHLEKVKVDGVEYVHGSWRRELNINNENKWIQPINDFDDICWTTIASTQQNANARASELGYFINKDSVEIHCDVGHKKICNANIAEKEDDIPNFGLEIADDVCEDKNLSLVILMDASMSVSDYFEASKLWISNLLENTAELFEHENDKLLSENTTISLRTALIIFDQNSHLIWNLNDFDGPYNHKDAKSLITQIMQQNQMKRLSGTHIKDVLEYTIDNVFPLMNPTDSNIVVMLSDGRPSSCYLDIDQNPCQISPNQISKDFEDLNAKFLIVAVGNEKEKYESVTRIESTFECLFQFDDVERMENFIIISSSYFDLDSMTQSIEEVVQSQQSHTCGLTNYECNIALHPLQNKENNEHNIDVFYANDWNYASYRFIVGNNDDIWPYYATIKVHTQCNDDNVELHCKLMHYDPSTQATTVIKEADQILLLSSQHIPRDYVYKFSFRGSSIDRDSGLTVLESLEIGETYVIQFYIVDADGKCNGLNRLAIINSVDSSDSTQTHYDLDQYLMDVESSIALIIDNDIYQHPTPSQIYHPIVTLCIAERSESNQQTQSPTQSLTQPQTTTATTTTTTATATATAPDIDTRHPTLKPTSWPTRDVYGTGGDDNGDINHCQPPKYFPSPLHWDKCDEESVEWKVDFKNWFYNVYEEKTYVLYEICVLGVPPYQSCKYMDKTTAAMSMVMFQIPCFCEVCLNEMTDSMKPENGYTTEVHQGWLWEYLLFPGECLDFEIVLDGYVSMQTGYYKVQGDNRWIEGLIPVPMPCQPAIGYPMDYDNETDETDNYNSDIDNETDICSHDDPMYPDHDCSYVCDDYLDNEWRMDYISSFNQDGNTVFVYNAFVESDIDNLQCTKKQHNTSQTLSKIYLRLGCDCKYQSESFLESITVNMEPFGDIDEDYWSWTLDLANGDIQELQLVLAGENMEMSYSDMTLVGSDRRCTSFDMIKVPNPCKSICNNGEWQKWSTFGQCSEECGGGYKYKTRECVSICDGLTKINNCYGENNHMSPCNTNEC